MNYSRMYGYYRNRSFSEIYPDTAAFLKDYKECEIPQTLKDESIEKLYNLLYARYGNSHIASFDENTFRYKVWSIVFMYGPTWEKRLEVQKEIRELSEKELSEGNHTINNFAANPNTPPKTDSFESLGYITHQTANNTKRGKLESLIAQYNQLATDVTATFIGEFKKLFLTFVFPEEPGWYFDTITEDEE